MSRGRIVFAVVGTYGDLHPAMAVALEMQRRGWPVLLLTSADYAEKAHAAGLPFAPMRPGSAELDALGLGHAEFVNRLRTDQRFMFKRLLAPAAEAAFVDVQPHLEGAALVVVNHFAFGAQIAAEVAGTPLAVLAMQPLVLFSAHDPPALDPAPWLPALGRALGPRPVRKLLDLALSLQAADAEPLRRLRARLGLAQARGSWLHGGVGRAVATVGLWSPLLGEAQADHPPAMVVAGSAIYDDEPGIEGAGALDAFVEAGDPPVVLTLGSYAGQAPGDYYRTGIAAARRLGWRTVVVGGPSAPAAVSELRAPDTFVTGYARYSQLFPRARVVAHHGGMGTCHQALRAGVPQLITPAFGDQPDNARRLSRLGVARAVPLRRYGVDSARQALAALSAPAVTARAAELAAIAGAEQGAARAADALERAIV